MARAARILIEITSSAVYDAFAAAVVGSRQARFQSGSAGAMRRNSSTGRTARSRRVRSTPLPTAGAIVVSRRRIAQRVSELAMAIDSRYDGQELTLVVVLSGAVVFAADLVRRIHTPFRVTMVEASSYRGTATRPSGRVSCGPVPGVVAGRNVLVVDDILDSGATLKTIAARLRQRRPLTLSSCVLLRKDRSDGRCDFAADMIGFDVPDRFVVGYGLDYDDRFRNLPDIRVLEIAPAGKDAL
ncbi:MAG: hypoxanthine phosphoribosyltransferase [Planctomycetaceae bacterium]|nr:hypoxanthine phosphoribosyltransferase [Planctomycetaceae bacterium]